MNVKKTIIMLVLAVALVAAAVYYGKKEQDYLGQASTPTQTIDAEITSATVTRVEVAEPGKAPVTLTRQDGQWLTNVSKGYKADEAAVTGMLNSVSQPLVGEVVSSSPASFEDYEVSETSGTRVKVFAAGDKPALDVILGKAGTSAFSTYLRVAGEEDVLRLNSNIGMTFKRSEGWREKQMVTFDSSAATRIEANGTSGTFTLAKKDDKWTVEQPAPGDAQESAASGIVNMLASLRAEAFRDDASTMTLADYGLEPARQAISVQYQDKSTSPAKDSSVTLLLGNKAEAGAQYYARTAEKPDVFMIGEYVAKGLVPELKDLQVAPPAEETTATATVDSATTASDAPTTPAEAATSSTPAPEVTPVPTPAEPAPAAAAAPAPAATEAAVTESTATADAATTTP